MKASRRTPVRDVLVRDSKPGKHVAKWLWVVQGKNHFADTEKVRRILDQNGIEFVGNKVLTKHLPKKHN
jgi:predicted chitinase